MALEQSPQEHVFVVRIQREASGTAAAGWRVSAVHVESGRRIASTTLRDVDDFIRLRIGRTEPPLN